jgi:hypothetical protein
MEARWLRWGFMAERLPDPWGDEDESGRWHVGPEETAVELIDALHAGGARTRPIVGLTEDEDVGGPWCRHGGRSRGARQKARRPAAELATPPGGTRW